MHFDWYRHQYHDRNTCLACAIAHVAYKIFRALARNNFGETTSKFTIPTVQLATVQV